MTEARMYRKVRAAIIGIASLLVACSPPEFDSAAWAAAKGADPTDNPRGAMVNAAERAGVRPGATRALVRQILGEADQVSPSSDLYDLGIAPYSPDEQFFIVDYDDQGAVITTRVYTTN